MNNLGWVKWGFILIWSFCIILILDNVYKKGIEGQDGGYLDKRRRKLWKELRQGGEKTVLWIIDVFFQNNP